MNKLDDFLKIKTGNAEFTAPNGWAALEAALPARKTGKIFATWALSLLITGGLATTFLVLFNHSEKAASSNPEPSKDNQVLVYNAPQKSVDVSRSEKPEEVVNSVIARSAMPRIQQENTPSGSVNAVEAKVQETTAKPGNVKPSNSESASKSVEETPQKEAPAQVASQPEPKSQEVVKKDEDKSKTTSPKPSSPTVRKKTKSRADFHKGKLYAVASVSIIGSYRSFQVNDGAAPYIHKQYDDIRQNSEQPIITNGATLALEYRLIKNFSIQGGISYNTIGYRSDYNFEVSDKALTDNTGRITGYERLTNPLEMAVKGRTSLGVLRIPFGISYNLLFNSNSLFHIYVGGAQDFILNAKGTGLDQLTLQQKSISKADFVNNAREMCFGIGVNYALSPNYGLGVDLYYNKWMTDIVRNKFENVSPFSGGFNVSISRKIF